MSTKQLPEKTKIIYKSTGFGVKNIYIYIYKEAIRKNLKTLKGIAEQGKLHRTKD